MAHVLLRELLFHFLPVDQFQSGGITLLTISADAVSLSAVTIDKGTRTTAKELKSSALIIKSQSQHGRSSSQ